MAHSFKTWNVHLETLLVEGTRENHRSTTVEMITLVGLGALFEHTKDWCLVHYFSHRHFIQVQLAADGSRVHNFSCDKCWLHREINPDKTINKIIKIIDYPKSINRGMITPGEAA